MSTQNSAPGVSRRGFLAGVAALTLGGCSAQTRPPTERVLFVGNSLIYYNDLPNQFAQLASLALGRRVEAEMLARGGAHISHHAATGVVQREMATGRYTALVLQEFGGGLSCHQGLEQFGFSCEASHAAHVQLANVALAQGAHVLLLGCYRHDGRSALALSTKEAELATRIGALHAGLGDFPALKADQPDWPWLDPADGQHPGPDLSLLMALRTVKTLYGQLPAPQALTLRYRDYRGRQTPRLESLASSQDIVAVWLQRALDAPAMEARLRAADARFESSAAVG